MTALPIQSAPAHQESNPASIELRRENDWIPISEAAELLEVSVRHLRRLCSDDLSSRGLARKTNINGGLTWQINNAFDKRLRNIRRDVAGRITPIPTSTRAAGVDLSDVPAAKRAAAANKVQAVRMFRAWKARSGVVVRRDLPAFIEQAGKQVGFRFSKTRLYEWDKLCPDLRDTGSFDAAVGMLLDQRGGKAEKAQPSAEAWALFERLYLAPQQRDVAYCWRVVKSQAREKDWTWPALRTVQLLVKERITQSRADMHRLGKTEWARRHKAPMVLHSDAYGAGQRWDSDHSRLDFVIRVPHQAGWRPHRAWVTSWIDWRTRCVVGWHVGLSANSDTIRESLRMAVKEFGVPEIAWLDNGKDFQSAAITGSTKSERRKWRSEGKDWREEAPAGLLHMLGIDPHFAHEYNSNGKARKERWYDCMHRWFCKQFDSYIGSGSWDVDEAHVKKKFKDVMSLPTLEEVRERLPDLIAYNNTRSDHRMDDLVDTATGELLCPLAALNAWCPTIRRVDDRALGLLSKRWSKPLRVTKLGVGLRIAGRTVHYGSTMMELEPFRGRKDAWVYVTVDPEDTSKVHIFDKHFNPVCCAYENESFGPNRISQEARRRAHQLRKDQARRANQRTDHGLMTLNDAELAMKEQGRLDAEVAMSKLREQGVDITDAPIGLVRTPVDGASDHVEQQEMRQAVGAEHEPYDDFDPIDAITQTHGAPPMTLQLSNDEDDFEPLDIDESPESELEEWEDEFDPIAGDEIGDEVDDFEVIEAMSEDALIDT